MNDFHRNFTLQLRGDSANDGRWLTFGMPAQIRYCNRGTLGDERQVESVYASEVLKRYLWARPRAKVLHGLDCGAGTNPEAVRIRNTWSGCHIDWCAADVNQVTADIYTECWLGTISTLPWVDFDLILAVSTIEHSDYVGDCDQRALETLRKALSSEGILLLTLPVGVSMKGDNFTQYSVVETKAMLGRFQCLHERYWRWNGDHFENCNAEDTRGCIYGRTNNAVAAAAVGAWTLAR